MISELFGFLKNLFGFASAIEKDISSNNDRVVGKEIRNAEVADTIIKDDQKVHDAAADPAALQRVRDKYGNDPGSP